MSGGAPIREAASLFRAGRLDEARSIAEALVARDPRDFNALHLLGTIAITRGDAEECIRRCSQALEAKPGHFEALCNRAIAWRILGQPRKSLEDYERAAAAAPDSAEVLTLHAVALAELGRHAEARALYDRALAINPRYATAIYNRALQDLALQRFAEGWDTYEARFATQPPMTAPRTFGLPRPGPADLTAGARLALWREQGLGDQILFATLLPELRDAGVKVVAEVDPRLLDAYRRSLPGVEFVVPDRAPAAFAACDFELPFGSLPRYLRRNVDAFARQPRALLRADAERSSAIRARIGEGCIGVSWRSFQAAARRRYEVAKSMPLEALGAFAEAGVRLLDLQYGDVAAEREEFARRHGSVLAHLDDLDAFNDLEGMLAAIDACAAVVTTSNVTAHLAGAIGKRTLLGFPSGQAPFHYLVPGANGRSLWYPSVEIVTDPAWEGWAPVVAAALRKVRGAP
jgi:tetratricopeptide (TPR) repeat protein